MSANSKCPETDDSPRDAELSRLYRESADLTPPPVLDARILAAAAAATKSSAKARPSPWWRRWAAPVAVLATMTLTVVLVLEMQRDQEALISSPLPKAALPADSLAQKVLTQPPVAETAVAAKNGRAPTTALGASPPAPVGASRAVGTPPSKVEAAPPAEENLGNATPAEAPRSAAPAVVPGLAVDTRKEVAPAAPAAALPVFKDASRSRMESAPVQDAAKEGYTAKAKAAPRLPEPWLADIRRLKEEGRLAEVAEQLRRFREAYPDYRLPEDLH